MNRTAATILAFISLIAAISSVAIGSPLSLDEYWQLLQDMRERLTGLEGMSPEAVRAELDAMAAQLEGITTVTLPDGTELPLDHSFLAARMRSDPPELDELEGFLSQLLATRERYPLQAHASSNLESLDRVLSRPEFQWQPEEPSPLEEWWRKVQETLWDLVRRLLPGDGGAAALLHHTLTVLGGLAMVAVLVYIFRSVWTNVVAEREADTQAEDGDQTLTATAALKRAQTLAEARDYRTAVRYLYLSSLLFLEEQGLLRYDRSLTNREYLWSVAQSPQLRSILQQVVEIFERVWYGYQPLSEADYSKYAAWVADLHRLR